MVIESWFAGASYSQRSTYLHTLMIVGVDQTPSKMSFRILGMCLGAMGHMFAGHRDIQLPKLRLAISGAEVVMPRLPCIRFLQSLQGECALGQSWYGNLRSACQTAQTCVCWPKVRSNVPRPQLGHPLRLADDGRHCSFHVQFYRSRTNML